jgi:hypothetical protein
MTKTLSGKNASKTTPHARLVPKKNLLRNIVSLTPGYRNHLSSLGRPAFPCISIEQKAHLKSMPGSLLFVLRCSAKNGRAFCLLSGALPDVRRQYSGNDPYTDCFPGMSNAVEKAAS